MNSLINSLAPVRAALAVVALCTASLVSGQESPSGSAAASSTSRNIRISFVPPPLEGTISLGIYDAGGKLVRVLHREADLEDLEIGTDALNTTWDGKDDRGESLPPGKYHARGHLVGELEVEGVGFFFNDWVQGERSARVQRIVDIALQKGAVVVTAKMRGGGSETLVCDSKGDIVSTRDEPVRAGDCDKLPKFPQLIDPLDCAAGRDGTIWVIDRASSGSSVTEVKQWSSGGELLRRLAISAEDPQPVQIAASTEDDRILLLEENATMQRVRALTLLATQTESAQAVSDWKVEFEKKILVHNNFSVADGKPVLSGGDRSPQETVSVKLQPNPLQKGERVSVDLGVGFDAKGSFLKTADGLPLQTISETPGLSRVLVARAGDKSLDVYQDDDAVVEQFRVGHLDQMMAFDCGDFELK